MSSTGSHTIERVGREHLNELLPLMRAYCDFYDSAPSDEALLAMSVALIDDTDCEGLQFLARDSSGRAVGFATVFWSWSTTHASRLGIMNDLFVAPDARSHGAAEQLIEACRIECGRRGAGQLAWQTAPDNLRAQAVYERVGGVREQWVDYWLEA
jgi:GNAT superfamily N-acetyltransferase